MSEIDEDRLMPTGVHGIDKWAVIDTYNGYYWARTFKTCDIFEAASFDSTDRGLQEARAWADKFVRGRYKDEKEFLSKVAFVKVRVRYFNDLQTMEAPFVKSKVVKNAAFSMASKAMRTKSSTQRTDYA